jgi:hypothetical protein
MELTKQKKESSISQAINEYNNNRKTHERISLRGTHTKNTQITGVLYSNSKNNKNNEMISTGKKIPLNFIEISSENSKCFTFKYTKNNLDKMIDHLLIRFGTFRFNFFEDYIYCYLNILSKYKIFIDQPIINSIKKFEYDIKNQKELYKMQKYIYNYISKVNIKKEDEQMKEYKNYLIKELNKSKLLGLDTDSFEINYLINLFSKGFDFDIDYESIELLHYGNNKKFCGKGIIPPSDFHLRLEPKFFQFKFFDFEFDLNDLENTKIFISNIMKIFEEKIKTTKLFIEPCISQIREDLSKNKNANKKKEYKNYENILSIVKENMGNKEINKKEENLKSNKKIQKKYSSSKADHDEEDLEDLNKDDSFNLKITNVKQSKIPNHFYSDNFIEDKKINEEEKEINVNISNNINKNRIVNVKKNNLPKVNKK